jgi:hypothetical protein
VQGCPGTSLAQGYDGPQGTPDGNMFERLRRGTASAGRTAETNGSVAADSDIGLDIETFEYVRVGRTALARVVGRWTGARPGSPDFALVIEADAGGTEIRALAEAVPGNSADEADPAPWRAAFPMTLEVIEHPTATFALKTSEGTLDLPKPILRALYADDGVRAARSSSYEADQIEELEAQIREAEAGVRWMQGQLSRERDRRRGLENEVESLRARNDELTSEPERIAALELEVSELRLERDKREHLEEAVASLTSEVERLKALEADANIVYEERVRREALEKEMAELAVDREHIRVLEEKVTRLTADLKEAREAAEAERKKRDDKREALVRENAAAEATMKRLEAELDAARKVRADAPEAARPARPFEEVGAEAAAGAAPCTACHASGSCERCNGKGRRRGLRCSRCGGTGHCAACRGAGYVWEDDMLAESSSAIQSNSARSPSSNETVGS